MDELVECDTIDGGVRLVPRARLRPRPTAYGAVTDDEGRLLALRLEGTGRLVLPGGGIDPGESAQEAVEREVFEETGVEVRAQAVIGRAEANYYDAPSGEAWTAQVELLACDVLRCGPAPEPAPEGEPVWIPMETLGPAHFQGPSATLLKLLQDGRRDRSGVDLVGVDDPAVGGRAGHRQA